jgi:hypothetical protein
VLPWQFLPKLLLKPVPFIDLAQVFEAWQAWTQMGVFNTPEAKVAALDFMQKLAINLKDKNKVSAGMFACANPGRRRSVFEAMQRN